MHVQHRCLWRRVLLLCVGHSRAGRWDVRRLLCSTSHALVGLGDQLAGAALPEGEDVFPHVAHLGGDDGVCVLELWVWAHLTRCAHRGLRRGAAHRRADGPQPRLAQVRAGPAGSCIALRLPRGRQLRGLVPDLASAGDLGGGSLVLGPASAQQHLLRRQRLALHPLQQRRLHRAVVRTSAAAARRGRPDVRSRARLGFDGPLTQCGPHPLETLD
mmetsp:Transcript_166346/g.528498  ORF Transcript_166346/g.528498 Transcript_166346/m.528498 type:complete len:215 (-) Transcript_166346:81-725(-)